MFIELHNAETKLKNLERISSIHSLTETPEGVRIWFYDADDKNRVVEEGEDFSNSYEEVSSILKNISSRVIEL